MRVGSDVAPLNDGVGNYAACSALVNFFYYGKGVL